MAAFTSALVGGLTALSAGATAFSAVKSLTAKKNSQSPQQLPASPSIDQAKEDERKKLLKRAAGKTKTIYSSPLGATDAANIGKSTLLGQAGR